MSFVAIQRSPRQASESLRHLLLIDKMNEQCRSGDKWDMMTTVEVVKKSDFADGCAVWPLQATMNGNANNRLAFDWFQGYLKREISCKEALFVCNSASGMYSYAAVAFSTTPERWLVCWRRDEMFGHADLIAMRTLITVFWQSNKPMEGRSVSLDIEDLLPGQMERACVRVFKKALDVCSDGIILCSADGSIVEANLKVSEWFGESVKALRSQSKAIAWLANIIHPDHLGQVTLKWRDLQQNTEKDCEQADLCNIEMILSDGSTAEFKITIVKLTSIDGGQIENWVFYIRDAEKIAREKKDQNIEHSRAHFLAEMSHEIRTPLSCIIGTADLMKYTNLQREQLELVTTISTCSRQLFQLVENVLDFSKIQEQKLLLNPSMSVLEKVIYEAVQIVSPEIHRKDLDFFLKIDRRVTEYVMVDSLRLRQVLTNLIGNAVKFTDDRTMVSVTVSMEEDLVPQKQTKCSEDQLMMLRFEIEDRGPGLDEGENSTLFESYVQLNETIQSKFGGTGLGLAISKRLVTMMGGAVWFESGPSVNGCKFIFTISTCSPSDAPLPPSNDTDDNLTLTKASKTLCEYLQSFLFKRHEKIILSVLTRSADLRRYVMDIFSPFPGLQSTETAPTKQEDTKTRYIIITDDATPVGSLKKMITPLVIGVIILTRDEVKLMRVLNEEGVAAKTVRRPIYTPCLLKTFFECLVEAQMAENIGSSNTFSVMLRGPSPTTSRPLFTSTPSMPPTNPNNLRSDLASHHPLPHHILIVDDNQINTQLMTRILLKLGYQPPLTAETGLQALDTYRQHHGRISCIFMDMEMPEMNGVDATIAIRDFCKDSCPKQELAPHIIALTANAFGEDREACLRAGMCRYLSKPVRWGELEDELVLAWRAIRHQVACRCNLND